MDEIKAVASYQRPTRNAFAADKPGGWIIVNAATGKRIGLDIRYATREEAESHIPAEVAVLAQHIADAEARETARTAQATQDGGYRTVRNSAFGTGRVYHNQPGATQYDDGSGRFAIQIWDNS